MNEVYKADYAQYDNDEESSPQPAQPPSSDFDFDSWKRTLLGQSDSTISVVDAFLREPVIYCEDPIAFWRAEIVAGRRVGLARMALDYLTVPCASFLS